MFVLRERGFLRFWRSMGDKGWEDDSLEVVIKK